MIYNEALNVSLIDDKYNSCTLYIVLFAIFFMTSVIISSVLIYFRWYFKKILKIFITSLNEDS